MLIVNLQNRRLVDQETCLSFMILYRKHRDNLFHPFQQALIVPPFQVLKMEAISLIIVHMARADFLVPIPQNPATWFQRVHSRGTRDLVHSLG